MHQRVLSWLLVCAFAAAVSLRGQTPAVTGGAELVLVAKVSGTVTKTLPGQTAVALKQDDKVEQKAKINTAQNSSVVLVFSNGATTQLGSDTELVIEEYLQDPFADTVKVADLTDEPSASRTKLALNRGELVGNVKKLKYDKGSSFTIQTPVGAAGIRGTTFRIVFRPTGTGQAFNFTLSTAVGNVAFDQPGAAAPGTGAGGTGGAQGAQQGGNNQGGNQAGGQPGPAVTGSGTGTGVAVPQGQEIVLVVNATTQANGTVVVTSAPQLPPQAVPISQTTLQQVNAVATEIAVAVQQAVFTPPPPAPAPGNSGNASGTNTNTGTGGTDTNANANAGGNNAGGTGNQGSGNQGSGTQGSTTGTQGSTTGTQGSTTGSTGSTGGNQSNATASNANRGNTGGTTTTTNVSGQTSTGQTFNGQVQSTTPPPATPPRIVPTSPGS